MRARTAGARPRRGVATVLGAAILLGTLLVPSSGGAMAAVLDDPAAPFSSEAPLDQPDLPADTGLEDGGLADEETPEEPGSVAEPTEDAVPPAGDASPADVIPPAEDTAPAEGPVPAEDVAPADASPFAGSVLGDLVPGIGVCATTLWQGPTRGTVLGKAGDSALDLIFDAQGPPAGPFDRVDGNDLHTLALDSDGYAYAWGTNRHLALGTGTFQSSSISVTRPVPVAAPLGQANPISFAAVSAGDTHSLALTADGDIYAWGAAATPTGLGIANATPFVVPSLTGSPVFYGTGRPTPVINPEGVKFKAIAAGTAYNLALSTSGVLYVWGRGEGTGISGITGEPTPFPLPAHLTGLTFDSIAAGNTASFAITPTGEIYAWGANASGKLGIGQTMTGVYGMTLVPLSASVKFKQVKTSWWNTVALSVDGDVYTWGANRSGALGIGTQGWDDYRSSPTMILNPGGLKFSEVGAGSVWAMALSTDGGVYTWGDNQNGQLGNGTVTMTGGVPRATKVKDSVYGPVTAQHISTSNSSGFALSDSGVLFGWGANTTGALGTGTAGTEPTVVMGMVIAQQGAKATAYFGDPPPVGVPGPDGVQIVPDLVPDPSTILLTVPVPAHVAGPTPVYLKWDDRTPILSGCFTYTLKLSLTATPSGDGSTSTLRASVPTAEVALIGDATVDFTLPPGVTTVGGASATQVPFDPVSGVATLEVTGATGKSFLVSSMAKVGTVDVSNRATATVKFADLVPTTCIAPIWEAGSPDKGSVQGFPVSGHSIGFPVPDSSTTFTEVSAGKEHTLALDARGNVWAWGANASGQLGTGTTVSSSTPVMVLGPDATGGATAAKITQISAGAEHSLALTDGGIVFQWGSGLAFGSTSTNNTLTPVAASVVQFKQISAGGRFSLALTGGGTVYSWGENGSGQLGNHGTAADAQPKAVPLLVSTEISQVSAGFSHAMALTTAGRVYLWGANTSGTIGNGQGASTQGPAVLYPIMQGSLTGVRQISAGESTSWVILTNGEVWAWGQKQVGPADSASAFPGAAYIATINAASPVRVNGLDGRNIDRIVAGDMQFYALSRDGDVYAWGANGATGQLGLGTGVGVSSVTKLTSVGPVLGVATSALSAGTAYLRTTNFGVAVTESGGLSGWGTNTSGQLTGGLSSPQTTPGDIVVGSSAGAPTQATAYFGNPSDAAGVDGYVTVPVTGLVAGGTASAQVPRHAVGTTQVFVAWGDDPTPVLYGCYDYLLELSLAVEPDPAPASGAATLTATVPTQEVDLTGAAVVDFDLPALRGGSPELALDAGANADGVAFASGSASTAVRLATPRPQDNMAGGGWEYPAAATARIGLAPVGGSDPAAHTVSNRPEALVHFEQATSPVYVLKVAESTSGDVVAMPGSEWMVYPDLSGSADLANPVVPGPTIVSGRTGLFILDLAPGVYWLEESKALAGFELLAQRVQFTLAADGTVTLGTRATGNSPNVTRSKKGDGITVNTIQVEDVPRMALPDAGGDGPVSWLVLIGVLLLAGAAVGFGNTLLPRGSARTPQGRGGPRHARA